MSKLSQLVRFVCFLFLPFFFLSSSFLLPSKNRFQSDYTNDDTSVTTPNQLRWMPLDVPESPTNFIQGISSMGGTGEPTSGEGLGIHLYVANTSMSDAAFTNAGTCSFNHFVCCFLFFVFVSTFILSILHSLVS